MGNDRGLLAEQLKQFARFQREHPDVDPERLVDVYTSGEGLAAVSSTEGNCAAPVPQRVSTRQSDNGNSQTYGHDGAPPTPATIFEGDSSTMFSRYLGDSNTDPFHAVSVSYNTINPSDLSVPPILQAVDFFEASRTEMSPAYGSSYESVTGLGGPRYSMATPETMSRNPSGRSELATGIGIMGLESSRDTARVSYDERELNLVDCFDSSFEDTTPPEFNNNHKRVPIDTAEELRAVEFKQQQDLHEERVKRGVDKSVNPIKSPKRPMENWPPPENWSSPKNFSTSNPKPRYVRPKHPRVMCEHCPKSKGFRGDHEYRRHFDRVHAEKKTGWVVRDRSGSSILSKCRACSVNKAYGVDYNAVAHLRRQHFNRDKDPSVQPPENIRDWIERVELEKSESGRGRKKTTKAAKDKKTDEEDEEDMEMEDSEEEGESEDEKDGRKPSNDEPTKQKNTAQPTARHCDEERQRNKHRAQDINLKAFTNAMHHFIPEAQAATYSKAAMQTHTSGEVSQQVTQRNSYTMSSSGTSILFPGAPLDPCIYAPVLIHAHRLPPQITPDFDTSCGVDMDEFFMGTLDGF